MKELIIDITGIKDEYSNSFMKNINELLLNKMGLITKFQINNNKYFLLACDELIETKIKREVWAMVCLVVRKQFKKEYIFNNLKYKYKQSDKYKLLVNSLCQFDREYEDEKIYELLNWNDYLCVLSFIFFKLNFLKDKWEEIVNITNVNSDFFLFNDVFFEFLKFIIDSLDIKQEDVFLIENGDSYSLLVKGEPDINITKGDITETISQLITYNPRKINVSLLDAQLLEVIISFFDCRVNII